VKQAIVTGTSRGLGKAIALQLLEQGLNVIGISRNQSIEHEKYIHVSADLADSNCVNALSLGLNTDAEEYMLIHNAGMLGEIGYVGKVSEAMIQKGFQLNLITPSILTNQFLKETQHKKRSVIAITSGASKNAYDGWGMYCSSKAGLDAYFAVVMKEMEIRNDINTRIYSIAPGVIDTSMQEQIRQSDKHSFSNLARFTEFKESNQLESAENVAKKIITFIFSENPFKYGRYDIRDLE
jgi:benzil reductase ((S)-benzoin forming)